MIDPSVIAARIRSARQMAMLTQAEVAHAAGIGLISLSMIENRRHRNPTIAVINRLATALHTTPGYLLGITEEIAS